MKLSLRNASPWEQKRYILKELKVRQVEQVIKLSCNGSFTHDST